MGKVLLLADEGGAPGRGEGDVCTRTTTELPVIKLVVIDIGYSRRSVAVAVAVAQ